MRHKIIFWSTLAALTGVWFLFRLYKLDERTAWGVEQSFTYWGVKNVAIDHHFTLIGSHFFSLVSGPIYLTPFFDWLLGSITGLTGLYISNLNLIFVGFALLSLGLVAATARKLSSMRGALIAVTLVSFSWFMRQQELNLWKVSLMITLSAAFVWWINGKLTGIKLISGGVILGLGFSLHLITLWLVGAVLIYLFVINRRKAVWQSFLFLVGVGISISPLILFNFRHDFMMRRGVINLITGSESGYQAGLIERLTITSRSLMSLSDGIIGFGGKSIVPVVIIIIAILMGFWTDSERIRRYSLLALIFCGVTVVGIFLSGRVGFSSQHYALPLIPLIYLSLTVALVNLLRSRLKILVFLFLVVFIYSNLGQFMSFKVRDGYKDKLALAEFIYLLPERKTINIRFVDQDVLAFDAVFYDASIRLGVPYNKVNLIERWGQGKEDGTIVDSRLLLHD